MNKSPPPDKEDLEFFRAAMLGVKRTKSVHIKPRSKKNISALKKEKLIHLKEEQPVSLILLDPVGLIVGSEDRLFFNRPGLQHKRIKQLTGGDISQSAYLDLHQMSVEQARRAVLNFLLHSREHSYNCVRIIHGKGKLTQSGAKLKNHVNCWLRQIPWVLAFSSAQARDGGAGALYVLLRRIRHAK